MTMTMTWRESAGLGNLWEVSSKGPTRGVTFRVLVTNEGHFFVSSMLVRKGNEGSYFQMHTSGNLTPGEDPWGNTIVFPMWVGLLS